jgi:hypothetical protein
MTCWDFGRHGNGRRDYTARGIPRARRAVPGNYLLCRASEEQPDRKLNLPRRRRRRGNGSRRAADEGCSAGTRKNGADGLAEVRVVQNVEKLCSKFGVQFLGDFCLFDDGNIQTQQAGSKKRISGDIAKRGERLHGVARWIEPVQERDNARTDWISYSLIHDPTESLLLAIRKQSGCQ